MNRHFRHFGILMGLALLAAGTGAAFADPPHHDQDHGYRQSGYYNQSPQYERHGQANNGYGWGNNRNWIANNGSNRDARHHQREMRQDQRRHQQWQRQDTRRHNNQGHH